MSKSGKTAFFGAGLLLLGALSYWLLKLPNRRPLSTSISGAPSSIPGAAQAPQLQPKSEKAIETKELNLEPEYLNQLMDEIVSPPKLGDAIQSWTEQELKQSREIAPELLWSGFLIC